jgi:hypothetical protein
MSAIRTRKPGETVFVVLLLALAILLFWQAYRISGFSALSSPGAFPLIATGAMVMAASVTLARTLALPAATLPPGSFRREVLPNVVGIFAGIVFLYGAALERVGFILSSLVFMFLGIWLLEGRGPKRAAALALLTVACIYVIFRLIFSVLLPEGVLPERRIIAIIGDILTGRSR